MADKTYTKHDDTTVKVSWGREEFISKEDLEKLKAGYEAKLAEINNALKLLD